MLTLQHLPVTSPSFFTNPSSSPATPNQPPSPFSMTDSPLGSFHYRPRRSSRSPLNPGLSTPPSTSSSYAAFPKFQLGEVPTSSPQNHQPLSAMGSRLKFGENWNDQDTYGASNVVPETLLNSTLPDGRFIETLRAAPIAMARVIGNLHGSYEVLNFCHASKELRKLVESFFDHRDQVRDAFLARSISGYQPSTSPNPSWLNRAIQIDLTDLELLLESNSVSLAMYPTHALRVITSPQSSMSSADAGENDNATARFQTLTLSHSRFVAFLRHRTAPQALQLASQDEDDAFLHSPDSSTDGQPEIIFPSPLYYFKDVEPPVVPAYLPLPSSPTTSNSKAAKSLSKATGKSTPKLSKSKSTSSFRPTNTETPESGSKSSRIKRLSIKPKGKAGAAPPPPPSAMPAMPALTSTPFDVSQFGSLGPSSVPPMSHTFHERSRSQSQSAIAPPPHTISHSYHSSYARYTPPSTGQYTPPGSSSGWNTPPPPISFGGKSTPPPSISRRRRARQSFHMPESSSGSSGPFGPSQTFNRSMPFLPGASMNGPPSSGAATPMNGLDVGLPASPSDIHTLSQVFRLTRAPIFRVFVPCSRPTRSIRVACLAQLNAASLVPHLRAGDLVCNLGYVPDFSGGEAAGTGVAEDGEGDCRGWMVFSGHELCPLTMRAVIPVQDPTFILTTPHYFSHVLLADENPRFEMVIPLVPTEKSQPPAFSLVRETRTIIAPKKGTGDEPPRKHRVNRFIWITRVECARWGNEWILEAEGTKEGREHLESALEDSKAGLERGWEVVRERTGRGKVYVRRV